MAGLLWAPHAAHALVPTTISQNREAVAQMMERGGIPGNNPYDVRTPSCGTVCSDLWLSEHRPMPNQPPSKALHNELRRLRFKAKLMPAFSKLPAVGLGVTAAFVGFSVGTAARQIFFAEQMPATGSNPGELSAAPGTTGATQTFSGLKPINPEWTIDPTFFGSQKWPSDGWAAQRYGGGTDYPAWAESFAQPWGGYQFVPSTLVSIFPGTRAGFNSQMAFKPSESTPPQATQVAGVDVQKPNVEFPTWSEYSGSAATVDDAVQAELNTYPERYPTLIPWLDHELGGSSPDPTSTEVAVPSCTGDLWLACKAKIEAASLVAAREVLSFANADLTKPAAAVITLTPPAPTIVEQPSTVTVTTNPDTDAMPLALPEPQLDETYDAYVGRLQALGHAGTVERIDLTDATLDPTQGPSAVASTIPGSGTRIAPSSLVKVRVNPATAPAPGGAPGPTVPAIDFSPLSQTSPCNKFPFGVPCWIVGALGGFSGAGDCPNFDVPFTGDGSFGNQAMNVDACIAQPVVDVVRPLLLIGCLFGMGWLFMGAAMGFGGRGGDD